MKRLVPIVLVVISVLVPGLDAAGAAVRGFDLACPPAEVPDDSFIDVALDDAHEAAIDCATAHGVVGPVSGLDYNPTGVVSRGQMATFMARLIDRAGDTLPATAADAFDDDAGIVHEANINRLAAAGIVTGTAERTFSPEAAVSRAQMATFLVRAYELAAGTQLPTGPDAFADDDTSNHEANIDKAAAAGFAAGTTPTTFDPGGTVRRNQLASFVSRELDRLTEDGWVDPITNDFVVELDPSPTGAPVGFGVGTADIGHVHYERAAVIPLDPGQEVTVRFALGGDYRRYRIPVGLGNDSALDASVQFQITSEIFDNSGSRSDSGISILFFDDTVDPFTFVEFRISAAADGGRAVFVIGDAVVGQPLHPSA